MVYNCVGVFHGIYGIWNMLVEVVAVHEYWIIINLL